MTITAPPAAPLPAAPAAPLKPLFQGEGFTLGSLLEVPPSPTVPPAPPSSRQSSAAAAKEIWQPTQDDLKPLENYLDVKIEIQPALPENIDLLPVFFTGTCEQIPDYPEEFKTLSLQADYVATINPHGINEEFYEESDLFRDIILTPIREQKGGAIEFTWYTGQNFPRSTKGLTPLDKVKWWSFKLRGRNPRVIRTDMDSFIGSMLFGNEYRVAADKKNYVLDGEPRAIPPITVRRTSEWFTKIIWGSMIAGTWDKILQVEKIAQKSINLNCIIASGVTTLPSGLNNSRDETYDRTRFDTVYSTLSLKTLVCYAILHQVCSGKSGVLYMNYFFHTLATIRGEEDVAIPLIGHTNDVDNPTFNDINRLFTNIFTLAENQIQLPTVQTPVVPTTCTERGDDWVEIHGKLQSFAGSREVYLSKYAPINLEGQGEEPESDIQENNLDFVYGKLKKVSPLYGHPHVRENNSYYLSAILASIVYSQTTAIKRTIHRPDKGIYYISSLDPDPDWTTNGIALMHRIHVVLDARPVGPDCNAYIIFRGSHTTRDWVKADIQITRGTAPYLLNRVQNIDNIIDQAKKNILRFLIDNGLAIKTKVQFYATGHSLGGFLAMMCSSRSYTQSAIMNPVQEAGRQLTFKPRIIPRVFNPFFGGNPRTIYPIIFVAGEIFTVVDDKGTSLTKDIASYIFATPIRIQARVQKVCPALIEYRRTFNTYYYTAEVADEHMMYQFVGSLEWYLNSDIGQISEDHLAINSGAQRIEVNRNSATVYALDGYMIKKLLRRDKLAPLIGSKIEDYPEWAQAVSEHINTVIFGPIRA
jgi:hypothetical protein